MAPRPAARPNPRGKGPLGTRPSPLWYGLALLLVLGLAQAYFMAPQGRPIPYSDFKALVKSGKVAELSIGDPLIHGTLKDEAGADKASRSTARRMWPNSVGSVRTNLRRAGTL